MAEAVIVAAVRSPIGQRNVAELGADEKNLHPNGGAIALDRPLGASGAGIMTTMLYHMRDKGIRYGLQTMCEGGQGQRDHSGTAVTGAITEPVALADELGELAIASDRPGTRKALNGRDEPRRRRMPVHRGSCSDGRRREPRSFGGRGQWESPRLLATRDGQAGYRRRHTCWSIDKT